MFRASLRSIAGPRGHVCLSCIARRYGGYPRVRLLHGTPAFHNESGGPPVLLEGVLLNAGIPKEVWMASNCSSDALRQDADFLVIKTNDSPENTENMSLDSSSGHDAQNPSRKKSKPQKGGDATEHISPEEARKAARRARKQEKQKLQRALKKAENKRRDEAKKAADELKKTMAEEKKKKKEAKARPDEAAAFAKLTKQSEIAHLEKSLKSRTTTKADKENSSNMEFLLDEKHKKEVGSIDKEGLPLNPLDVETSPVPQLSFGLERVLFNPGVYHLRDPRSRVFNFDPYLGSIMPVTEFDFNALKEYITSSKDDTLHNIARNESKKYVGSSSSMTSVLSQFHYLLSAWRGIDARTLSQGFPDKLRTFTRLLRAPSAMFLRYQDGVYAIDADKEFDSANILMNLGKSMEKLLTLPKEEFERYRRSSENKISPEEEQAVPESYHYSTIGDFIMRSQLDAYDPRLPGTGMFDLKTRAVVSIRMDAQNFEHGLGYEIKGQYGAFESYEREFFDMIRAAFLKYSLQVRIGRMDGIFVAFHNIERIFGFQYISLPEMDQTLHGQSDTSLGDTEFRLSLGMWNKILDKATAKFPQRSLRFHFETRDAVTPFMYIFAEPVTEEEIHAIQTRNAAEINAYQERVLNLGKDDSATRTGNTEASDSVEEQEQDQPEVTSQDDFLVAAGNAEAAELVQEQEQHKPGADVASTATAEKLQAPESAGEGQEPEAAENSAEPSTEADAQTSTSVDGQEQQAEATDNTQPQTEQTTSDELYDSSAPPDESLLSSEFDKESKERAEGPSRELFAMTLVVRNIVNGKRVDRPSNFKPTDEWKLEYELRELPSERAQSLYGACQRRRQKALEGRGEDETDVAANVYIRKLREISEQGRRFREEQEKIDQEKGVVVLGDES